MRVHQKLVLIIVLCIAYNSGYGQSDTSIVYTQSVQYGLFMKFDAILDNSNLSDLEMYEEFAIVMKNYKVRLFFKESVDGIVITAVPNDTTKKDMIHVIKPKPN